jgi:hypothetical protein
MLDHRTVPRLSRLVGPGTAPARLPAAAGGIDGTPATAPGRARRAGGGDVAVAGAGPVAGLAPLTVAGHQPALARVDAGPAAGAEVTADQQAPGGTSHPAENGAGCAAHRRPTFVGP